MQILESNFLNVKTNIKSFDFFRKEKQVFLLIQQKTK